MKSKSVQSSLNIGNQCLVGCAPRPKTASEDDGSQNSAIRGRERLFGKAQIAARQRFPSFRAPGHRIEQMSNGKSGAQNRAPSGVKREQSMRRGFVEPVRHLRNDSRTQ